MIRRPALLSLALSLATVSALALSTPASATAGGRGATAVDLNARLAAQRAIESTYWTYRDWPGQNPGAKPVLDHVVPASVIRDKVETTLRLSNALRTYWNHTVSGSELQAEIDRQARDTRQPKMLSDLWSALGNDPSLIAETLGRSILVDRLARSFQASDPRFSGQSFDSWWAKVGTSQSTQIVVPTFDYRLLPFSRHATGHLVSDPCPSGSGRADLGRVDGRRDDHLGRHGGRRLQVQLRLPVRPGHRHVAHHQRRERPASPQAALGGVDGDRDDRVGRLRAAATSTAARSTPAVATTLSPTRGATTTTPAPPRPASTTRRCGPGTEMIVWGGCRFVERRVLRHGPRQQRRPVRPRREQLAAHQHDGRSRSRTGPHGRVVGNRDDRVGRSRRGHLRERRSLRPGREHMDADGRQCRRPWLATTTPPCGPERR